MVQHSRFVHELPDDASGVTGSLGQSAGPEEWAFALAFQNRTFVASTGSAKSQGIRQSFGNRDRDASFVTSMQEQAFT